MSLSRESTLFSQRRRIPPLVERIFILCPSRGLTWLLWTRRRNRGNLTTSMLRLCLSGFCPDIWPSELVQVEAHFPLLVALVDDESLPFKVRGCSLLSMFLTPLKEGHSDILQRANLSSVFEDALVQCLLFIPTVTSEDKSLQLLGAVYPVLLSVLRIRYQNFSSKDIKGQKTASSSTGFTPSQTTRDIYIRQVANILRINLIPSIHHISSTAVEENSVIASFPFSRLSTFLLE